MSGSHAEPIQHGTPVEPYPASYDTIGGGGAGYQGGPADYGHHNGGGVGPDYGIGTGGHTIGGGGKIYPLERITKHVRTTEHHYPGDHGKLI